MADASFVQTQFLGAEWSKTMQGRTDRPDYKAAMNVCLNGLPVESGAWTRRPGTLYGGHSRNGATARAITFSFQENAPYTLEFTDSHLRFWAGNSLAMSASLAVSAISTATPAVAHIAAHTWNTGDQIIFPTMAVADPYIMNRQFIATVVDSTHISLADALTGAAVNGALLVFTTGAVARIVDTASPYPASVLNQIRMVQSEKRGVLLQKFAAPQIVKVVTDPTATAVATFSLNPSQFVDGPYLDPIPGMLITPAAVTGSVGLSFSFQAWSATALYSAGDYVNVSTQTYKSLVGLNLNNAPASVPAAWAAVPSTDPLGPNGLQNTDIGRHVRILSEPPDWVVGTSYAAGNKVKFNNAYWTALAGSNTGNQPGIDITKWAINAAGAVWSWGKIISLSGATTAMISRTAGTAIGTMTSGGGLAAAFDGTTSQASSGCATAGAPTSFVGKNYTSPGATTVGYGLYYTSSDVGFGGSGIAGAGVATWQVDLRGSQSAPVTGNEGTLLGSSGKISNILNGVVQVNCNDETTAWKYVWFNVSGFDPSSGALESVISYCAEAQFFSVSATVGTGMTIQLLGPDLLYTTAASIWRLGLYNDRDGWPACGTAHEGRLWLAGMVSNRLDAGQPDGTLFNFAPTEKDGTVTDASAISYTLDGPDVNAVFWLIPDQQGIIVGTQAGEWLVQASALNSPLSALNMQAHRVTTIGCANIEPRRTEHTTVFVQKQKHKIMEYFADVFSGKFSAPNLTLTAKHLAARGLEELAYQQELTPVIWARCTDGSLIGASYKRESLMSSQGPSFIGIHRHILGSSRVLESIAVGPSAATATDAAGVLDTLAMVTNNPSSNIRHIEFLTNLFDEGDAGSAAWFLDSAIKPAYTQNISVNGALGMQCVGLWHLNGKTVTVFSNGLDCGDWVVSNGSVFAPYGKDPAGLFTATFAAAMPANSVVVGLTYTSDGQLLRTATPQESGARNGPAFGKLRRIHQAAFELVATQGFSYGTSFDHLTPATFKTPGGTLYAKNTLYSGIFRDTVKDADAGENYDSMICWRVTRPYPACVAAAGGFLHTQDA